MLTNDDLEWYADLLSNAIVGTAKIGLRDASRIARCGVTAHGDKRLYVAVMQKVSVKYPKTYPNAFTQVH